jgi:hypothetical protein
VSNIHFACRYLAGSVAVALGLALLALVTFGRSACGQDQVGTLVRPDPPAISVTQEQTTTLSFVIENARDLYGADVRVQFDPAVAEVVDAYPGQTGVQITPGSFLRPDFVVRSVADNTAGTIWYASTQVSPTLPISGTGTLFSVVLRGKAVTSETSITISAVELADRDGNKPPANRQSGMLRVLQPPVSQIATVQTATAAGAPLPTLTPGAPATPGIETPVPRPSTAKATPDTDSRQPPPCAPPGIFILAVGAVVAAGMGRLARRS